MLSFTLSILWLGLGLWLCRPVSRRDQRVIGWVFGICLSRLLRVRTWLQRWGLSGAIEEIALVGNAYATSAKAAALPDN